MMFVQILNCPLEVEQRAAIRLSPVSNEWLPLSLSLDHSVWVLIGMNRDKGAWTQAAWREPWWTW